MMIAIVTTKNGGPGYLVVRGRIFSNGGLLSYSLRDGTGQRIGFCTTLPNGSDRECGVVITHVPKQHVAPLMLFASERVLSQMSERAVTGPIRDVFPTETYLLQHHEDNARRARRSAGFLLAFLTLLILAGLVLAALPVLASTQVTLISIALISIASWLSARVLRLREYAEVQDVLGTASRYAHSNPDQ